MNKTQKRIQMLAEGIGVKVESITMVKGGLTNETYLVSDGIRKYIARLAGEGTEKIIDRENELWNMKIGQTLGISPAFYAFHKGDFLMEYIESPQIRSEDELQCGSVIDKITYTLLKLHTSGEKLKKEFCILKNITLYKSELAAMGADYPADVLEHELELWQLTVWMQDHYKKTLTACHIDNIFGNIFINPDKAILIDWEYSGMADIYCDLANFALLNDICPETEALFLSAYFEKAGASLDHAKYILYKMALNYMWVYWHLIKFSQNRNIEYNNRRWRERLYLALDLKKQWERYAK